MVLVDREFFANKNEKNSPLIIAIAPKRTTKTPNGIWGALARLGAPGTKGSAPYSSKDWLFNLQNRLIMFGFFFTHKFRKQYEKAHGAQLFGPVMVDLVF